MTIDQSEARRWATRLLEENCENAASYEFDRYLAAHDREVDGDFGPYTKKGLQSLLAR